MATKRKHDDFLADMKSMLDSGKYSDFTITCQGREWKVHKLIICSQSKVLEAASRFGKEAGEGKIDLTDDEPEILEYMLRYMYEGDYQLPSDGAPRPFWIKWECLKTGTSDLRRVRHIEEAVWQHSGTLIQSIHSDWPSLSQGGGERAYVIYPTVTEARTDIKNQILKEMESIWDPQTKSYRSSTTLPIGSEDLIYHAKSYALAKKYFVQGLKDAARGKFEECANDSFKEEKFYEAANIVFTTTPDTDASLREVVAKLVYEERLNYKLKDNDDLRKALKDIPDLAYWVLLHEESISD